MSAASSLIEKYGIAQEAVIESIKECQRKKDELETMKTDILKQYYLLYPEIKKNAECVDDFELYKYDWTDHRISWPERIILNNLITSEDEEKQYDQYMEDMELWETMFYKAKIKAINQRK